MSFMKPDVPQMTPAAPPAPAAPQQQPQAKTKPKKPLQPSFMGGGMDTSMQSNAGGKQLVGQ